jgi:hypothetical protein
MKPVKIFTVLDLARTIRGNKGKFNPLFVGPPGLGKSEIVQAWANQNQLPFIDLRAAYLESPDVIGFPSVEKINGRQITVHNTPEFWPTEGEGVLLLEEVNRANTSVMNTFMQLLTDRKVHNYTLPEGWIIVGCINPEGSEYDVNTMDAALKDRFEIFKVEYDKETFVNFMKESSWDKNISMFVQSNSWQYFEPAEVVNNPGAKYLSPRTFSKLNNVLKSSFPLSADDELMTYKTILGDNVGKTFYDFKYNQRPILYGELLTNTEVALRMLKGYANPDDMKNDLISITVQDIIENKEITDDMLVKVLEVLPVDAGVSLICDLEFVRKEKILVRITDEHAHLKKMFKDVLKNAR